MRIYHGVAGHVVEVDEAELQWKKTIDIVTQYALERFDMAASDLIALSSGGGMVGPGPSTDSLERNRDVFIFLRSDLDPRAEVAVEPLALSEPRDEESTVTASPEDELLRLRAKCADPAFEAFLSNIEEAHRWLLESRPVNALAVQAVARLEVQRLAAQAVVENLTSHRATCSRSMTLFLQKYSKVQERFDLNLANVEPSMNALALVSLHPAIDVPGCSVLADLVPRERINHFTGNLQAERMRLAKRIEKLRQQDAFVQSLCEQVKEHMLQFSKEEGVESVAEKIKTDYAHAESELLPELRAIVPLEGAESTSVIEEEKRSAGSLEGLARVCSSIREQRLPELQARWEQRRAQFLQRLREVSYVQSKVRDVERQAALLEEEVNVQRNYSQQLGHLKKMPRAYQKMLYEVARRRQFHERYLAEREQAQRRLQRMAEVENSRRRAFLQHHGCHLPAELAHGLGFVPPVTVDVAGFDTQLPDIDFKSMLHAGASAARKPAAASGASPGDGLPSRAEGGFSRDRTSSTSSCGSSSRQPWAAKGVGSTNSSGGTGPGGRATPQPSLDPDRSIQGDGLVGGSQGGSSGQLGSSGQAASHLAGGSQDGGTGTGCSSQSLGKSGESQGKTCEALAGSQEGATGAVASSQSLEGTGTGGTAASPGSQSEPCEVSGLEAQNRELSAQLALMKEELAQLRAAQPVAAVSQEVASPSASTSLPSQPAANTDESS